MTKLSERVMLSKLHVRAWGGTLHDSDVTEEVGRNHAAPEAKAAGKYIKQIVSRKSMRDISSAISSARTSQRHFTLPWGDDGTRVLSTLNYVPYAEEMRLKRLAFEAAVQQFVASYDDALVQSKIRLGTLFDPADYPTANEAGQKFGFDLELMPMTECGDFRAKVSDGQMKSIVKDIERRTKERLETAIKEVFQRILEVTGKMAERLKESDAVFRDTLVTNCIELADLLPSLNITEDKRLDDIAKRLRSDLGEHSPEILRTDPAVRARVASKADALFERVRAYL